MKNFVMILVAFSAIALSYVLVSVNPLFLMVKEIYSGDVEVLINPNSNPHTFQLSPSSMKKVKRADILIVFGGGFEEWLSKIRGVKICKLSDVLGKAPEINPHVWLDPIYVQAMAVNLESCLEDTYPKESEEMRKNLIVFLKKLSEEERSIATDLSKYDRPLLELRPALYHFVKRFLSSDYITLTGQSQPSLSPRKLKEILKICKREHIKVILIEKNSSEKIAYPVIKACSLKTVKVDVLGTDVENFEELLERVKISVEEALR